MNSFFYILKRWSWRNNRSQKPVVVVYYYVDSICEHDVEVIS